MRSYGARATLTIEEAAERLGISRMHTYELAADQPSVVVPLGQRQVVGRETLERGLTGERIRREGPSDDAA